MLARSLRLVLAALSLPAASFAQCAGWDRVFDPAFKGVGGWVYAVQAFDDGSGPSLYVAGNVLSAGGVPANRIARWDGEAWSALGTGLNLPGRALAVFDDGGGPALYAAGGFSTAGGVFASRIARWDGAAWSALAGGAAIDGGIECLAVFDDGAGPALYAAGSFMAVGSVAASRIARWDGSAWSPLGSGVDGIVRALAVHDDGAGAALYAGGEFAAAGGAPASRVARWDGSVWSPLGAGTDGAVRALAVHDDGGGPALYAGGDFASAGGSPASRVARWDGASWSALGAGANATVSGLGSHDDGSGPALYAGGDFTAAGGGAAQRLARWKAGAWSTVGGAGTSDTVTCFGEFDDGTGAKLVVGGEFVYLGPYAPNYVATWDGSSWASLAESGEGTDGLVETFAVHDDGSGPALFAAGGFSHAGATPVQRIARWQDGDWSPLGPPGAGLPDACLALASFGGGAGPALYAAGAFTHVAGVAAFHVARWKDGAWAALGGATPGTNQWVHALAVFDDGSGPALYLGGKFTAAGGVPANHVARFDGTSWSALGSGTDDWVYALAVVDDGSGPALFAAGEFENAGGAPASRVARWDGTSWSPLGPGIGSFHVRCLAGFDDGSGPALYAGGAFSSAGGAPAAGIARWDGASWSPVGAGLNGVVSALQPFDDGWGPALYAGGYFLTSGAATARRIARWDGTSWTEVGSGASAGVVALAAFDDDADGDADLYLGGFFTEVGGVAASSIARWLGCGAAVSSHCAGDGSAAACPCANAGIAGHGCDNSASSGGALLTAVGSPSQDTLVLAQSGELASSLSIFLQGDVELPGAAFFGDGLRCTGGDLKRLFVANALAGTVSAPQPGDPSIRARSAELGDPLAPGSVRHYQVYYRDPVATFCASPLGDAFNVGNALRVVW